MTTEIDATTTEMATKKIRILLRNQKREHSKVVSSQYEIECVLYKLKTSLCNNAIELFKTLLTGIMSVSYAYKLINFYKICKDYSLLKYSSLQFKIIYTNIDALVEYMKREVAWWNNTSALTDQ